MENRNLFNLAKRLVKIRGEAKKLGIFTDGRELLECPKCGLMEDIDVNGKVFIVFKKKPYKDTGLEFKEVGKKRNRFFCPNCREVITVSE